MVVFWFACIKRSEEEGCIKPPGKLRGGGSLDKLPYIPLGKVLHTSSTPLLSSKNNNMSLNVRPLLHYLDLSQKYPGDVMLYRDVLNFNFQMCTQFHRCFLILSQYLLLAKKSKFEYINDLYIILSKLYF